MEDLGARRASSEVRTFNPMIQPMMQPLMQPMMQQPGGPPQMGMQTPKDRTPFTYTPGGLDLSEIKSERMARRLMRNAMSPGVQEIPVVPTIPNAPVANAVHRNSMPVQVFPTFQLPPNPRMLLRTRSNPYNRAGSVDRAYERQDQFGNFDEGEKVTDLPPLPPRQDNNDFYNQSILSQLNEDSNVQKVDYGFNNIAMQNIPPQYAQNYGMMLPQPNVGPYSTVMAPQYMDVSNNQSVQYVLNNRGQPIPQNVPLQYIPGYGPVVQSQGVPYNQQLTDIPGNPNVGYIFNNGTQQNVAAQNTQLYEQFIQQQNSLAESKMDMQSNQLVKNENFNNVQDTSIKSEESNVIETINTVSDNNNTEPNVSENDQVVNIVAEASVTETKDIESGNVRKELKADVPIEGKHTESDQSAEIIISSKSQETFLKETVVGTPVSKTEQTDQNTENVSSVETIVLKKTQKESSIKPKTNGISRDENENIVDAFVTVSVSNEVNDSDENVEDEEQEEEEEEVEEEEEEEEAIVQVNIAKPVTPSVTSVKAPSVIAKDVSIDKTKAESASEEEEEEIEEEEVEEEEEEEVEKREVSKEDIKKPMAKENIENKENAMVSDADKIEDNKLVIDNSEKEVTLVEKTEEIIEKDEENDAGKITNGNKEEEKITEESKVTISEEIVSEKLKQDCVTISEPIKQVTEIEISILDENKSEPQLNIIETLRNAEQAAPLEVSAELPQEKQIITENTESFPGMITNIETNTSQIFNSSSITKQVTLGGTLESESFSSLQSKLPAVSDKSKILNVADNARFIKETSSTLSEVSNIHKSTIGDESIFGNTNMSFVSPNNVVYPPLSFESTHISQPTADSGQYPNIEPYTFIDPKDAYVPSFQKLIHPKVPNLSDRFSVDRIIPKKSFYNDIKPFPSFKLPQNQNKITQNNLFDKYSNECQDNWKMDRIESRTRQDNWKSDRIEHLDEVPSLNIDTNQYSFLNTERPVDPLPLLRSEHSPNFASPNYITKHVQPPMEIKPSIQPEYKPPVYSPINTPFMRSVQAPTWQTTPKTTTFPPKPVNMFNESISENRFNNTPYNFTSQSYATPSSTISKSDIWTSQTQYTNSYYSDEIEEKEEVEPPWRRELREFTEKKLQPNVERDSSEPVVRPPWMDEVKFRPTKNVQIDPNVSVIPSWAQQRPRSWRESSVDNDQTKRQANISWQKTNTFNRRPKSAFVKSQLGTPQLDRTRCVSMDRERFAANYQSPISQPTNNNGYSLPWDSSPERSPMLSPLPSNYDRTSTPHSRTSPYQHNTQSPTYGYYQTPIEQSREYGAYSYQPRNMNYGGTCPVQSRSFKYLQLLTGTEDDEPFIPQQAMHSQPRPNRL